MSITVEQIAALYHQRVTEQGKLLTTMRQVKDAYNGDIVVPLPEMDRSEKAAVANLVQVGLDHNAMRIASVTPDIYYPPVKPGNKRSEKNAAIRRRANFGWWERTRMGLKLRRRARYLIGYGMSSVIVRPNFDLGIPTWHVRDPLTTFPAPAQDPDHLTPVDVIYTLNRSLSWLQTRYPDQLLRLEQGAERNPDAIYTLLEYVDGEEHVLAVLGKTPDPYADQRIQGAPVVELERVPNRIEVCPAVVAGRITLERRQGQFDQVVGMHQAMAKLMALEMIAAERAVFPDTYLVSRPGETAAFIAGPYEGRTGDVNIVSGGDVHTTPGVPGPATGNIIDRIERAERITAGVASEYGGESPSNVRTGKRGDAVMSAMVDMPIAEHQEILAASLVEENRRAISIAKNYFGNQPQSFYVSWRRAKGQVDYTPNDNFDSDRCEVTYPQPGLDSNQLVVGIGQRLGLGVISRYSAQILDPMVSDPERERDRVEAEAVHDAVKAGLLAQVQQGTLSVVDAAKIAQLVVEEKQDLFEAILTVQNQTQTAQASSGPPGSPEGTSPAGSPETQPGLGTAAQQPPEISGPNQNVTNLADLLRRLHGAQSAAGATDNAPLPQAG